MLSSNITAHTGYTYQCPFLPTNGSICRGWDKRITDADKAQILHLSTTLKTNNAHKSSYDGKSLAS